MNKKEFALAFSIFSFLFSLAVFVYIFFIA